MKIHQKKAKITLVFDGIKVAFSHPLGLTVLGFELEGCGSLLHRVKDIMIGHPGHLHSIR